MCIRDSERFERSAYTHFRDPTNETFSLIYPGTIAPRYGLETAVRALPLLVERIPDVSLIIIGPESRCKDQLKQLINELGVSSYASLLPLVPGGEIPQKIAQADVGIYPALPDAHMNIATPTKVLEFAVMGIPIISSRLEIIEEMFGNSSVMVFDPGDIGQFAECVVELYESPSLREELVSKTDQNFVQKHSWENEFLVYYELLNLLLVDGG
jgi:glycosyltransferase involved in cell wall biosynthesis